MQNHGTYRAALKAPDRLVVRMATRVGGAGGYRHYLKHQKRGDKTMPCAIVLGCPPYVAFVAPQKLPIDVDEFGVAGGLAGAPINVVRARTVDLLVPAEAEIVIEGCIDTEYVEPEGPFGESHGHVALEEFNMPMRVTAITHRKNAIVASYISQVTPSESSAIKRVAYEPMFLAHLRNTLGIRGVKRVYAARAHDGVAAHHASSRSRKACRARKSGARSTARRLSRRDCGKICIAVERRHRSRQFGRAILGDGVPHESGGGPAGAAASQPGPRSGARARSRGEDATLLMDATMKDDLPPLALPKPGIHGARAQDVGGARPAEAASAIAVVRRTRRATGCRNGTQRPNARWRGIISKTAASARNAAAQGVEARNEVPAGSAGLKI